MKKAKENVEKHYAVVGVLEDFNKTLAVLEHYIPTIFKGSLKIYWGMHNPFNITDSWTSNKYIYITYIC